MSLAPYISTKLDFGLGILVHKSVVWGNISRYLIRFAVNLAKFLIQCICRYVIHVVYWIWELLMGELCYTNHDDEGTAFCFARCMRWHWLGPNLITMNHSVHRLSRSWDMERSQWSNRSRMCFGSRWKNKFVKRRYNHWNKKGEAARKTTASHTRQGGQKCIPCTILILSRSWGDHELTIKIEPSPSIEPRMSSSALSRGMHFSCRRV